MNIYDTANKLAQEIKQSEEYITYKIHSVPSPILAYLKGRAL